MMLMTTFILICDLLLQVTTGKRRDEKAREEGAGGRDGRRYIYTAGINLKRIIVELRAVHVSTHGAGTKGPVKVLSFMLFFLSRAKRILHLQNNVPQSTEHRYPPL